MKTIYLQQNPNKNFRVIPAQEIKVGDIIKDKTYNLMMEVIEIESRTDKAITFISKWDKTQNGYSPFYHRWNRKRNNSKVELYN